MTTYRVAVIDDQGTVLDSFDVELESPAAGNGPQQARAVLAEAAQDLRLGVL